MLGKCPNCGNKFEIQPTWVGKISECPYCHQQIVIELDTPGALEEQAQAAGIGVRFLALFIDAMILGVVNLIISLVLTTCVAIVTSRLSDSAIATVIAVIIRSLISLIGCAIGMAYEAYFLHKRGATPGKMVFGLKVQHNGENPSVARSIGRYWARSLSGCICLIGYIMAFFNPEHKALHDTICDTIVVKQQ